MFKVGDKVWTFENGWGVVKTVSGGHVFPVVVKFEKSGLAISHTLDGKEALERGRVLLFEEVQIPESALIRPRWRAEDMGEYFHINTVGAIISTVECGVKIDDNCWKVGNYFRTEEEAKESKIYRAFHEED